MLAEALHILTGPGHMVAELFTESLFLVLGMGVQSWRLKRHDVKVHGHDA